MAGVTAAFDTLKAATQLQEAGFEEEKARALVSTFAQGMVESLATKQDLAALATKEEMATLLGEVGQMRAGIATLASKEDLTGLRSATDQTAVSLRGDLEQTAAGLRDEMHATAAGLRGDIEQTAAGLRGEMREMAAGLQAKVSKVQERMTVRMGTAIAAAVAILVAVDKLL